jgi:transposase
VNGKILSGTEARHTHIECRYLKQIDRETPKDLAIHMIADNYSAHKQANLGDWLKKHSRFHMYFTPTGSSWMNLVERSSPTSLKPKKYVWRAKGEVSFARCKSPAKPKPSYCKPTLGAMTLGPVRAPE